MHVNSKLFPTFLITHSLKNPYTKLYFSQMMIVKRRHNDASCHEKISVTKSDAPYSSSVGKWISEILTR